LPNPENAAKIDDDKQQDPFHSENLTMSPNHRTLAKIAILLLPIGVINAAEPRESRTWTSADGKFSVQAAMLGYEDQQVLLRRDDDGREIRVPVSALSSRDRAYVANYIRQSNAVAGTTPRGSAAAAPPAATASPAAGSSDWPRWRGVNLDGISSERGLLKSWPADGPPLLWQVEELGTGFASVSVVDNKIYTMGRLNNVEHLLALDVSNGSQLWATPVGPGRTERGSNCTPTVDGEHVYGISIEGDLICARSDNGQLVWKKNFAYDFGGRMMSGWGYSESPLVDGSLLVCTPGGPNSVLAAMDKRTGKVLWTTPMPYGGSHGQDGAGYSSIVISHAGGVKQYVQLVGRGLIGVQASNGQLLWRYDRIANGTANIPTPVVFDDFVFCSTGYGTGSALLRIVAGGGRAQVQEQYFLAADRLQNHHGGMILVDGHLYCGHGHNNGFPVCVEVRSGRLVWGGDQRGPGTGSAAIAYADGQLYFRYQDGSMALIQATPNGYQLNGSFRLPSVRAESWPQPVIANGRLYLRDQEVLMCYDVREEAR
jgi:outer membrane protein assembly factor BamB